MPVIHEIRCGECGGYEDEVVHDQESPDYSHPFIPDYGEDEEDDDD